MLNEYKQPQIAKSYDSHKCRCVLTWAKEDEEAAKHHCFFYAVFPP